MRYVLEGLPVEYATVHVTARAEVEKKILLVLLEVDLLELLLLKLVLVDVS